MQHAQEKQYDIVIAGAGPAGCACALALKDAGLKVAMLDKATFPRDKVCGDAIPGRAIKTLNNIDPAFAQAFKGFPQKLETKQTTLFYKEREMTFDWVQPAYTCTRMEFDNFLFSLVKQHTATDIFTGTQVNNTLANPNSITITTKDNTLTFNAPIVIGADGAHSVIAKQLTQKTLDRKHYVGSVRAYFSNISGLNEATTEIYFDKRFLPSYLWVFPLPGNTANVGFGMLSSEIAKRNINLKKTFYEFIDAIPSLKARFKDAVQDGPLEGFGLPLGSRIGIISGNNFMLAGDAASLIDPISGDGIGNAMLSGKLAAEQAIRCFQQNNFSAAFMHNYDKALLHAIGSELKVRYKAQLTLSALPFLLDTIFMASENKLLKKLIKKGL